MNYLNRLVIIYFLCALNSCAQQPETKLPSDFEAFWSESLKELEKTSTDFEIKRDSTVNKKKWILYKINSFRNISFFAWVSEPIKEGKFPIKIRFSAYGNENQDYNIIPHSWFLKEDNTINMLVDVRGQGLSINEMQTENYLTHGLSDEKTYVYRGAYLDAVRAVDFVNKNPKGDGNIIVMGGTQGGALSVAATALNPKVTMCVIGFPFLTDMANYNKKNWPMIVFMHYCMANELDYFVLKKRLSYFDILNFVHKVKVPIFVKAQDKDPVTPIEGVIKFYESLALEEKKLYIEPCEGHGCVSKSSTANNLEKDFINKYIVN